MAKKKTPELTKVENITHKTSRRTNIPTAEAESFVQRDVLAPVQLRWPRNPDLDPQLVWKGKDAQDGSDLVVNAPPIYIQEKIHPKVLVDNLLRQTAEEFEDEQISMFSLFDDFNGLPKDVDRTEYYHHDQNWTNRMILGDSLQVMASLGEREGLRGKVQCIYMDPPYGIKFNSNFQWSTTSTQVKDGKIENITREPEQVKAFRDTWRYGINSYLSYLRDRFTVARDLLAESGSIFVQISDENVHRVRAVLDEVFGEDNYLNIIPFVKTSGVTTQFLASRVDFLLWYAKNKSNCKYRATYAPKSPEEGTASTYTWLKYPDGSFRGMKKDEKSHRELIDPTCRIYKPDNITSQGNPYLQFNYRGKEYRQTWKTNLVGLTRLARAERLHIAKNTLQYVRYLDDFSVIPITQLWTDTGSGSFTDDKIYIVQTGTKTIQRCLLMATDPGDLVLDPTCGSGTTAYVAEQWGRRWITIDTSRVSLALARARLMGAVYPYYLLADSPEGQAKLGELSHRAPSSASTYYNIKQGFVYQRVPHITLKSIANNAEIDVIWEEFQPRLEALREQINQAAGKQWEEWEIPREHHDNRVHELLGQYWKLRIKRQQKIDESIAALAEFENLYDKPYEDKKRVRVSGPFTVESLSPFRMFDVEEDGTPVDPLEKVAKEVPTAGFEQMILEQVRTAGIQQANKKDRIDFIDLHPTTANFLFAEGSYQVGEREKKAGVMIGPEFGTVTRSDLVRAAKEAGDFGFDVLISLAFNYDAQASTIDNLGRVPILRARINADLHMAGELKNTGKGNLFIIFGEPDIEIKHLPNDQIQVKLRGVDVYVPSTGEIRSDEPDTIACWFIDTDYNDESFFVRQAYFPGTTNNPYDRLGKTLKAQIDEAAWEKLNTTESRPFDKPRKGRIAVKVINHLGDEVMKVFNVNEKYTPPRSAEFLLSRRRSGEQQPPRSPSAFRKATLAADRPFSEHHPAAPGTS